LEFKYPTPDIKQMLTFDKGFDSCPASKGPLNCLPKTP